MRKNHFIISENDRRNILSMYKLLIEDVIEYQFNGVITSVDTEDPIDYVNISIVSDNKTVINTMTNSEGKYSLSVKLDNSKKYKFIVQDSDKKFTKLEKEIDLSKTIQNVDFKLSSVGGGVVELEEFTQTAERATNINLNVKNSQGEPITNYNLKIVSGNKTILDQDFSISNPNITVLKSELILNNLTSGSEYENTPVDGSVFNKNKMEDVKINIQITKEGFSDYSNEFNIKAGNFVLTIPSSEKTATKGKKEKQVKSKFIKPTGNEEISVKDDDKNIINVVLTPPTPEQLSFVVSDQNKEVVSNANLKLKIDGDIIGEIQTNENGVAAINLKPEYVDENVYVTFEKEGYKRTIKNFKIQNKENKFTLNVASLSSEGNEGITGELYDNFKDTNRVTYGRGRTDLSQEDLQNRKVRHGK